MAFRLAVGQVPAHLGPKARLEWLESVLVELNADLLLLPELFACGYNIGDEVYRRAEPAGALLSEQIAMMARHYQIAVHYGYAERDADVIYNSAQCFGSDGSLLGRHRKLAIPPGFEREVFTPGQGCQLFTYRGFRIGTLICYDAEFAETARHVAALGADLILVPTALGANWQWVARQMIPTRGFENGVFLAYANSAGAENGLEFLGESFIAAPDGSELARADALPGVITAELDLSLVAMAQARLPYLTDCKALQLD